jgi:hypothetical protein
MMGIITDPNNPNRLVLTATVTIYLDKLLGSILDDEIAKAIREQAVKDLQTNAEVKKAIAKAATEKLLQMLGADVPEETKHVQG